MTEGLETTPFRAEEYIRRRDLPRLFWDAIRERDWWWLGQLCKLAWKVMKK